MHVRHVLEYASALRMAGCMCAISLRFVSALEISVKSALRIVVCNCAAFGRVQVGGALQKASAWRVNCDWMQEVLNLVYDKFL